MKAVFKIISLILCGAVLAGLCGCAAGSGGETTVQNTDTSITYTP